MKKILYNILLLFILFIGNILIKSFNFYILLIYICISIYHIIILCFIIKNKSSFSFRIKNFIINSILLYLISYFLICDSNPFLSIIFFYTFFPTFLKAVLIICFHSYFLSLYLNDMKTNLTINLNPFIVISIKYESERCSYFLHDIFIYLRKKRNIRVFSLSLICFIIIDVLLFLNKINIWIYFNDKTKTLPILSSKNTTFYIASNIFNMENTINNYISEMKKLITYLGEDHVIISIVENGDSKDNTRNYLEEFRNYLNERKIVNNFLLNHEIDDQRKIHFQSLKNTRLRIEFYSQLRNKCFELLYELTNIDYNNTMIIFFNDVIFRFEDIINLLSTNKEDYDVACGLDMFYMFYDRWVSIDLEGEGMSEYFPYFINKEGQDLVINHQPIRVFSCWNGVIAFKALPLKDKRVKFRNKNGNYLPKAVLTNAAKTYYESECTYFNIDLFSLGYTKKLINPDVRVSYEYKYLFRNNYFVPSFKHIINYFLLYFVALTRKRNKNMSNYSDKNITMNSLINQWYMENKINDSF